jgi:hypothetical protein
LRNCDNFAPAGLASLVDRRQEVTHFGAPFSWHLLCFVPEY